VATLPAITKAIAFASTVLDLPVGCAILVCFCYEFVLCLMAALKGKAVVKIGMQ